MEREPLDLEKQPLIGEADALGFEDRAARRKRLRYRALLGLGSVCVVAVIVVVILYSDHVFSKHGSDPPPTPVSKILPSRPDEPYHDRPIIGILTLPLPDDLGLSEFGTQYIGASYVRHIQSGAARVVPIYYNSTKEELDWMFDRINGLVWTGGFVSINPHKEEEENPYVLNTEYLINKAVEANKNGDYFPVMGTCLGVEMMMLVASGDQNILSYFDSENYRTPFIWKDEAKDSRLLSEMPADMLDHLGKDRDSFHNHHFGVSPETFSAYKTLDEFYRVVATSVDRLGNEFVSLIEAYDLPFYGHQYHPEKPPYEFSRYIDVQHDKQSIDFAELTAEYFVREAKYNAHSFKSDKQASKYLITNFQPTKTLDLSWPGNIFEEIYFFY